MNKTKVIDTIFQEIERVKKEGNFHVTGDVYIVLRDLQDFLLDLKTTHDIDDL